MPLVRRSKHWRNPMWGRSLPVVELADTADLSPAAAWHPGSNPGRETIGETQKETKIL